VRGAHQHLRPLELKQQNVLYEAAAPVSTVYFPYDAVVSLVVTLSTEEMIEAQWWAVMGW
jgi:hypothetical protein